MNKDKYIKHLEDKIEQDRIRLLQYDNLRNHFNRMVTDVLGKDYYNLEMDVYGAYIKCCEDITAKANKKKWWQFWR